MAYRYESKLETENVYEVKNDMSEKHFIMKSFSVKLYDAHYHTWLKIVYDIRGKKNHQKGDLNLG